MKAFGLLLILSLAPAMLPAQVAAPPPPPVPARPPALVLRHVTVVDVRGGALLPDHTVVVEGSRIAAVGPADAVAVPDGAHVVDAAGRYVIPGLWDMHVHLFNQVSRRPPNVWYFPLLVANGVTGVREMWTKPADAATLADWRARTAAGELLAPRIAAAGTLVDGPRAWWPAADREACASDEERILAKRERLYAGPFTAAQDDSLWDRHESLRARSYDAARCDAVARRLAAARQWQVPTLVNERRWFFGDPALYVFDPRLAYVPADERRVWVEGYADYGVESEDLAAMTSELEAREAGLRWAATFVVVRALADAGVPFLAGTDLGGPYIFPGFSLHDELEILVEAGLSPLDALRAATLEPARYLEATDSLGSVEPGKVADLVLLDANPLDEIRNTRSIAAVVLNGRYLDRAALDALLDDAREAADRAADGAAAPDPGTRPPPARAISKSDRANAPAHE